MCVEPAALTQATDKADEDVVLKLGTNPFYDSDEWSVKFCSAGFASWKVAFQQATKLNGQTMGANWCKITNIVVIHLEKTKQFELQCACLGLWEKYVPHLEEHKPML
jgi:hypothetical protein